MGAILFLVQLPVPAVAAAVEVITLELEMVLVVDLVVVELKPVVPAEVVIHHQPLLHKAIAGAADKEPREALRILVVAVVVLGVWVALREEHQVIMVGQVGQVELV